jgi:hypothetical protein
MGCIQTKEPLWNDEQQWLAMARQSFRNFDELPDSVKESILVRIRYSGTIGL